MAYNIRPLSFAEILDRAFALLRDRFWLVVGIAAVVYLPWGVLNACAQLAPSLTLRIAIGISAGLALFVAAPVMSIAIAVAVANVYMDRPTSVGEAYHSTRSILPSILGTWLLCAVFLGLWFLALVIPGIYFMTCWALIVPVMIIEHRFGMAALRRSRELVRGAWWRTFAIGAVAGLIAEVPASALAILWAYIPVLGPLLNAATLAVTVTYSAVALVIYYFDRRCRTEDFDLRLLAEQIRSEIRPGTQAVPGTSSIA